MPVITADIMSGMVLVIMAVIIPRIALMTIAAKITKVTEITKGAVTIGSNALFRSVLLVSSVSLVFIQGAFLL